jgi:hypothetical protein
MMANATNSTSPETIPELQAQKQDNINKLIASLNKIAIAYGFAKMDRTTTQAKYNSTGNKGSSSSAPPVKN